MKVQGDLYDTMKENIQCFFRHCKIARQHTECRELAKCDFQTVEPNSIFSQVVALNGLRNIPDPCRSTLSGEGAIPTTTGIPPGAVVGCSSIEETDSHAMLFQELSEINTYKYAVNKNCIWNTNFNHTVSGFKYGISHPLEDGDLPRALPTFGTQGVTQDAVAPKPGRRPSPMVVPLLSRKLPPNLSQFPASS